eukprot:CAMPEP_0171072874 /NCGR_PEP_ID=MMETSP0766_2-20121228/11146_1 /TAXON_ID=439317 /ORGANISM="Gambierdiscus australes, Strain CAWD 149" /LENGTH=272 /DNA_ID=CAMNT_0011529511 /DNA_START=137 /DNA_END=955 /DNA_ORIENTATION=-
MNKTSKLEGMLTTQGVVAALVLGLVVGLQGSIPEEEYDRAEFRYLLSAHPEFRAFAKAIWQQEGHEFRAQVGSNRFFDTRVILDDSSTVRRIMGSGSKEWEMGIEVTYNHMKGEFPVEKIRSYLALNYDAASPSGAIIQSYTIAFALLTVALSASVTMYASLLLSPINEDAALVNREKGEVPNSEKSWVRFGMPCIMVNNLVWIAGAMAFVFGTVGVTFVRSPRAQSMWFAFVIQTGVNLPGCFIMGFLWPLIAFVAATRASYRQHKAGPVA